MDNKNYYRYIFKQYIQDDMLILRILHPLDAEFLKLDISKTKIITDNPAFRGDHVTNISEEEMDSFLERCLN